MGSPAQTRFRFRRSGFSEANAFFILDCLGVEDLQSGRGRSQGMHDYLLALDPEKYEYNRDFVFHFQTGTAQRFFESLTEIALLCRSGLRPVLFIDGHGHPDKGLRLPSGEHVSWPDLLLHCQLIVQNSGGELTVIAAACHSMEAIKHLEWDGRLPFAFYYGYPSTVSAGAVEKETRVVYESLLRDGGLSAMRTPLALQVFSEYDHVMRHIAAALLISSEPAIMAGLIPELSREMVSRVFEENLVSQGMRLAGARKKLNSILNSDQVAVQLARHRMHDTPRLYRFIEDIRLHIAGGTWVQSYPAD